MRRVAIGLAVIVISGVCAGAAQARPIFREVTFEATFTQLIDDPACGAPFVLEEHDVGRITVTIFFDKDGSFQAAQIHDAAITITLTNTRTGATVTGFYTNLIHEHATTDPATGAITDVVRLSGLNFLVRRPGERPLVSAGLVEITEAVTFDENGDPVLTLIGLRETPDIVHAHTLVC